VTSAAPRLVPQLVARAAPAGAIVLAADYRGLGVVRSLGRHGIPVCVLTQPGDTLAAHSRYARRTVPWTPGDVDGLLALADEHDLDGWALFPTTDEASAVIGRHYHRLEERFTLTSPPWDVVRWAYDKRATHRLARATGVDHPSTFYPRDADEVAALELDYPVILKPAVKEGFNRLTAAKAWRVDSREELLARYVEACGLVDPAVLTVQELVPGGGESQLSYAALAVDGQILAHLTARRTRQYPADFGRASTLVETVDAPELIAPSERLLAAIEFTGIVELEYKRDPRDGVLKLFDVNPRVWGWQSLCGAAGVDFPWLLWLHVCGEPVPHVEARPGVRWLRLSTDTPTAVREVLRGRLPLLRYLRSLAGRHAGAIFAADDPLPALVEGPLLVKLLARRLASGDGV
jgi:predicted ATP-grasp superfamily ATP-dependent carboligase